MARYIDVDPLRKKLCEFIEKTKSELFLSALGTFVRLLDLTPTADAVQVVRCKDCKWYDPPHIDHNDGKRTDVEDDAPFVPSSVGINVGGKCMNTLREYCLNHDRENPDDYERIVKFRNRMDYCSDAERKDNE